MKNRQKLFSDKSSKQLRTFINTKFCIVTSNWTTFYWAKITVSSFVILTLPAYQRYGGLLRREVPSHRALLWGRMASLPQRCSNPPCILARSTCMPLGCYFGASLQRTPNFHSLKTHRRWCSCKCLLMAGDLQSSRQKDICRAMKKSGV